VTAADASGTWRPYEVVDARGGVLALGARGRPVVEPELWPRLVVALALTKGGRYERVAQRVTELAPGVPLVLGELKVRPQLRDRLVPPLRSVQLIGVPVSGARLGRLGGDQLREVLEAIHCR